MQEAIKKLEVKLKDKTSEVDKAQLDFSQKQQLMQNAQKVLVELQIEHKGLTDAINTLKG